MRGEQLSEKVKSWLNQNTGSNDCYISPNSNNPSEDAYSPTYYKSHIINLILYIVLLQY